MPREWTAREKGFSLSDDEQNGVSVAVNTILFHSYTPEGVKAWWDRRRPELGDHTPAEALPYIPTEVVELALGSMEQTGS